MDALLPCATITYKSTSPNRTGAHSFRTTLARSEYVKQHPCPTYQGNLAVFIGELRDLLFSSQEEAATYFHLDRSRISRYESNKATPKLGYIAGLARLLAERYDDTPDIRQSLLKEVNQVIRHRYRHGRFQDWEALCRSSDAYLAVRRKKQSPATNLIPRQAIKWQATLDTRLAVPPGLDLVGVDHYLHQLFDATTAPNAPWLICIDGIGGIGKTTLVMTLIRRPELADRFCDAAWVSAKQQQFEPGLGIVEHAGPALQVETLIDILWEQLGDQISHTLSPDQKRTVLIELLKKTPYLIVIDNLESMIDSQTLLPVLRQFANPTKILLTSRHSLRTHTGVFSLSLDELSQQDATRLIEQEIAERGLATLTDVAQPQLEQIYDIAGGNPLALKLLVGQISVLPVSQVLENLKQVKGKTIEELYTFIYWHAWKMLDAVSQQVFLVMPLAQEGSLVQLRTLTGLEPHQLSHALQQLVQLSLVQVRGSAEERTYTLHRLTETFILTETIAWKTST